MKLQTWRFGTAEFNEATGKLSVRGKPVEIDRNGREILSLLLRNPGSDVRKETLLQAGWPNRIVHENSLAKAVGRLRDALGDNGPAIRSTYGYGYRFDGELKVQPSGAVQSTDQPNSVVINAKSDFASRRQQAWAWVAAHLGIIFVATVAAFPVLRGLESAGAADFVRTTPPIIGDAPDAVARILWVDDHPVNNLGEKRYFEDRKIAVHEVTNSQDAMRLLSMYRYDLVISDMGRGEDRLAGLRLAESMRDQEIATPLVIYTVRAEGAKAQEAQRNLVAEAGGDALVVTPLEVRKLVTRMFVNPAARASLAPTP